MEKSPTRKKKWFTAEEKVLLRQLVRLNSSVINTGRRKGVSVQAKKRAWQGIMEVYNKHPSTVTARTVIELRRCWDCMKFYAKKKSAKLSECGEESTNNTSCLVTVEPAVPPGSRLQQLALHPSILASILSKGDGAERTNSSSAAGPEDDVQERGQLHTAAGGRASPPPCSAPSLAEVASTLRQQVAVLRRRLAEEELLLVEERRRHSAVEHHDRLRREREEHEAKLMALRQDFALKRIMFRVQVGQVQSEG